MNKDLLFCIIESYDCLVAGETHLYALMHTQKHAHACLRGAFVIVGFSNVYFHFSAQQEILIYQPMAVLWWAGGIVCFSLVVCRLLCVCLDTFGARLVRVSLFVCLSLSLLI